jgi:hypothetical protein
MMEGVVNQYVNITMYLHAQLYMLIKNEGLKAKEK